LSHKLNSVRSIYHFGNKWNYFSFQFNFVKKKIFCIGPIKELVKTGNLDRKWKIMLRV